MKQSEQEKQVARWRTRFEQSRTAQASLFDAAKRWYDAFYAVYRQKAAPWRSKVIDPKIANYTLNYLYKVSLTDPEPNFVPHDKHDFVKARSNEDLVKYQLQNPQFDSPMFMRRYSALCDAAVCGTGYFLNLWEAKEVEIKTRRMSDGSVSLSKERVITRKTGYNNPTPISFFRVFFEPHAQSMYSSRYVVYLDYKSKDELEKLAKTRGGFMNLDKVSDSGSGDADTFRYEASRNSLLSIQGNMESEKQEIRICYDTKEKKFYWFANEGGLLIYTEDNPYWHGQFPGSPVYIRPRAFSVFGDGLFERNERLGAANDSITNHFFDQLDLSLNGLILRNENTTVRADARPGGEVVYNGDKPEQWVIPQPDVQGFQTAKQTLAQSIEEGTLSGYETGNTNAITDKTKGTAAGINAIQNAGSDKIRFADRTYGVCCGMQFYQMYMNNQQLLDHETSIRVLGPNGWVPKVVKPEDIIMSGPADIQVTFDTSRNVGKEIELARMVNYVDKQLEIAEFALKSGTPLPLNYYELSRVYADGMGQKQFDRIMQPIPQTNDSAEAENDLFLMGKSFEPSQEDNHELHIQVHKELLDDKGVDEEIRLTVRAHSRVHEMLVEQSAVQQSYDKAMEPTLSDVANGNVQVPVPQEPGTTGASQPGEQGGVGSVPQGAYQPGAPEGVGNPS